MNNSLDLFNKQEATQLWALVEYARRGQYWSVKEVLKKTDPNVANPDGTTAVIAATAYGSLDILKLLATAGADFSKKSAALGSALNIAKFGHKGRDRKSVV